ncbi:MAG: 4Fe-4S binding protein [Planctomycetota bacterium]
MRPPHALTLSRRTVQVLVLLLTVLTPVLARHANYLSAQHLDKAIEQLGSSPQGLSLRATDALLRAVTGVERPAAELRTADRDALLAAARGARGSVWSFELFGITITDPLAALESAAASRTGRWVLLSGVLLPLLLTAMLGRVFCAWICPAGFLLDLTGRLRGLLRFLELKPGRVRLWSGDKFLLLALGVAASLVAGLPLLGYVYPPALVGREVHNGLTAMFDRAEDGMLGFSAAGLTIASWFLLAVALAEIAFGRRLWCRALCPGGALYSLLGRYRLLRIRRTPARCDDCGDCVAACEMGLSPMTDRFGMECDGCGACITSCPTDALAYRLGAREARRTGEVGS